MKYADFKIIALVGDNPKGTTKSLVILAKKKNGLFFTASDRNFSGDLGSAFTFFLGGSYAIATYKKTHIELCIPEKEENLKVKLATEAELEEFMDTDYHGFQI